MKIWILLTILVLGLFFVGKPASALARSTPYLTLAVGTTSASCWNDHSQDVLWTAADDYLDVPQVALQEGSTKYSELGPDNSGGWTAYVWAGNHMVDGTLYDLTIHTTGPVHLMGYDAGGNIVFDQITSSQFSWTYSAVAATTAQWRTRGNRVEMTPAVPEPSSILVVGSAVMVLGLYRKKR